MNLLRSFRASTVRGQSRAIAWRAGRQAFRRLLSEQLEDRNLLAAVVYVNDDATGPVHDGMSWSTAYTDLQQGLAAATSGDAIWVARGTYKPTAGSGRVVSFNLKSGVSLYGGFAGGETEVSQRNWVTNVTTLSGDIDGDGTLANNSYHVVSAYNVMNTAVLDGFQVTGGNADSAEGGTTGAGGGIYNFSSSPTLNNLAISGNSARVGGGIYNTQGSPRLTNVTLRGNYAAEDGGAMVNRFDSRPVLTNATIAGNQAAGGDGGGIYNDHSSVTVNNGTITGNQAGGQGGGIFSVYSPVAVELTNALISGNQARFDGGAIYNGSDTSADLTNVTITENSSLYGAGGGIFHTSNLHSLNVQNSILWNNSDPEIGRATASSLVYVDHSIIQGGWAGVGNLSSNPLFMDAAHGDFRLRAGSPAIDTGTLTPTTPTSDLDGRARPQDGDGDNTPESDMGAYEYPDYSRYYVNDDASGNNTGTSWTDAFTSLQSALAVANAGDEIWVAAGTYKPTADSNRARSFNLRSGVSVYGGFDGDETALSQRDSVTNVATLSGEIGAAGIGDNSYHVVSAVGASNVMLDGFAITGGNANGASAPSDRGGGIYLDNSSAELTNLVVMSNDAVYGGGLDSRDTTLNVTGATFTDNHASYGGGMQSGQSGAFPLRPVTLTDVVFEGNSATEGGGYYNNYERVPATLTDVTFRGNTATNGGGFYAYAGDPRLFGVTFDANHATGSGGGMFTHHSETVLRQVQFKNNTADGYGGGMYNVSEYDISHPALVNVLFSANYGWRGGGIVNDHSSPSLMNVTLVGNSTGSYGAAIHNYYGDPTVTNSILWGNSGPVEIYDGTGSTTTVTYSIVEGGFGGTGNLSADPRFVNAAGGDFHLLVGSPAIDTATSVALNIDLDGNARPQDGNADGVAAYDRGAYEYQNTPPLTHDDSASVSEDSGATAIDVLANDTDADDLTPPLNSALSVIGTGPAGNGTVTFTATGVSYTPSPNYYGPDSFTYTITDGFLTSTGTVNITVANVNDAPVANSDSATVDEDSTDNVIGVLANDTDPDNLSGPANAGLSVITVGTASHGSVSLSGGVVRYTPSWNYYGPDSFSYTVTDGILTRTAMVSVTVVNVPDSPRAVSEVITVNEDSGATFVNVLQHAFDPDNLSGPPNAGLVVSAAGPAGHGTVTYTAAGVSYTPNPNFYGSDSFQFTISDGSLTDSSSIVVQVLGVPDAPVANGDSAIVSEDSAQNAIDVLANDTDADNLSGPANMGLLVIAVGTASHGTAALVGGVVQYTPAANFYGTDSFTYTVIDAGFQTATGTVNVTVTNVNDAPVANPDSATVDEDSTGNVIDVLANDTSAPDTGETLTVTAVESASHGTVSLTEGVIHYTPAANYYGADSFTYTLSDGNLTATGTVNVTVLNVNDAPTVAMPIPDQTTHEDEAYSFAVPSGTFADVDVGDSLTLAASLADGSALPGWLTFDPTSGTFSGTPANGDVGSYQIKVTATDSADASMSDTFELLVLNVNDAPTLASPIPDHTTLEDEAYSFVAPSGTFADVDVGDSLTLAASLADGSALPGWLTFNPANGTFSGTPANGDVGSYQIKVTATDRAGAAASDTFELRVLNVNDAPTLATPISNQTTLEDEAYSFAVPSGTFADVDVGDSLTLAASLADGSALPGWLTFNPANGTFSGTPANGDLGSYQVKVTATDRAGAAASDTFELRVLNVNDAPIARNDNFATPEDSSFSANVLTNDSDPDGEALTVVAINGSAAGIGQSIATPHGSVTLGPDGSFTYTPGADCEATSDGFSYTISDGHGGLATATVTITIQQYAGVVLTDGILRVGGTAGGDVITVTGGNLIVNGMAHSLAGVNEVRIWGRAGNDQIDLSGLRVRSAVHGGQGNDLLTGGAAADVIFGGDGDDTITGAAGDDFLIGGAGRDRIVGSSGNDILVAGDVLCEISLDALRDIGRVWAESQAAPELESGGVLDEAIVDTEYDSLTGSSGADLFFINSGDKITDFHFGKPNANKQGDEVRMVD